MVIFSSYWQLTQEIKQQGVSNMFLRDMQLDVPYRDKERSEFIKNIMKEHNCTYKQALRIDYDRNWKFPIRRRFLLETNCIVAMFLRLLGKYKNEDCKKIVVDCVENVKKNKGFNVMGIYTIEQKVDYNEFFLKDDKEKKQFALNVIKQSIAKVAREKKWDISPFEEVFKKIIELDYNNFWTWGKKVKSPSKQYTAEVYLEHEVKNIDIYVLIRDKQGDIVKKQLVITELPDEYAYFKHLEKLIWLSDNEVLLINRSNDRQWSVQL